MDTPNDKEDAGKKGEKKTKSRDKTKDAAKASGVKSSSTSEGASGRAAGKLSKLRSNDAAASTNTVGSTRAGAAATASTANAANADETASVATPSASNTVQNAAGDGFAAAESRSTDQIALERRTISTSFIVPSIAEDGKDTSDAKDGAAGSSIHLNDQSSDAQKTGATTDGDATGAAQIADAPAEPVAPVASVESAESEAAAAIAAAVASLIPQPFMELAKGNEQLSTDIAKVTAEIAEKARWEAEFSKISSDFEKTLVEIEPMDDLMSKYTIEYKKVFRALGHTKTHAFSLYSQYEDVVKEHFANYEQQTDGAKALDQDQQTLKSLKQQIRRSEQMLEQSNKREDIAKNEQRQLRHDINTLTTTIKQGVGLSAVQERTINELVAAKEQMIKDLDGELEKIVSLRNGLTEVSENIKVAETQKREIEREIFSLKERNAAKKLEIDTELRNKERLDRELRELRVVVTVKSQEVQSKQEAVNRATEDIATIEGQIRQQKQMIEKLLRDQESLGTRTVKLQQDYDEQMSQTSQLMDENDGAIKELRLKERELANHRAEVRKVTRIKETLLKKNRQLEDQKLQAENDRKVIRSENDALMADIERLRHLVDVIKKNIDDLTREKDILSNNLLKAQSETQKVNNMVILQKQQQYNIELEIAQYRKEAQEHLTEIHKLEAERDAYISEAAKLQAQCVGGLQELKDKELQIFDFKRQMLQTDAKHKHQQNLYESVQSERNLYAKHLIESQSEIAEMKRKLKIMNFQINGYKEDINSKSATLKRESSERVRLQRDTDQISEEIKTLKNQNELAQTYIRSQVAEESKLSQFVKETEVERARQENALQVLIGERDNLSSQLIRRNDELTSVYDKIKIQQLALARGETYYRDKLRAIRTLRLQIHESRQQLVHLTEATSGIETMKKTTIRLQSEITQEQMRVKALEEELENPINVHRWRKLEGSNPQAFELIQLLHTLQKKLIVKAKEDNEKEQGIKVQEELYLHLKSMLAKQVGPEAVEQIGELEKQLKEKQIQLRHMDTELNMYQAQVREYRYSIGQLDQSLAETRKQFLALYRDRVETIKANGGHTNPGNTNLHHGGANQAHDAGHLRSQRSSLVPQTGVAFDADVKGLPALPEQDGAPRRPSDANASSAAGDAADGPDGSGDEAGEGEMEGHDAAEDGQDGAEQDQFDESAYEQHGREEGEAVIAAMHDQEDLGNSHSSLNRGGAIQEADEDASAMPAT